MAPFWFPVSRLLVEFVRCSLSTAWLWGPRSGLVTLGAHDTVRPALRCHVQVKVLSYFWVEEWVQVEAEGAFLRWAALQCSETQRTRSALSRRARDSASFSPSLCKLQARLSGTATKAVHPHDELSRFHAEAGQAENPSTHRANVLGPKLDVIVRQWRIYAGIVDT